MARGGGADDERAKAVVSPSFSSCRFHGIINNRRRLYPAARVPKVFSPPTRAHIFPSGPLEKKAQLLKRDSTTAMRVM